MLNNLHILQCSICAKRRKYIFMERKCAVCCEKSKNPLAKWAKPWYNEVSMNSSARDAAALFAVRVPVRIGSVGFGSSIPCCWDLVYLKEEEQYVKQHSGTCTVQKN